MIFKIIALVLMAAFYACYFIKMLGQKKKGIKTTQIGKGKTGFVKWVECTMMVSTVLVVVVELISIILGTTLLPPWARWLGVGIAAVGVAIFITAVVTMRDSWRAGVSKSEKTELVTSGIFGISRNPAFLGFDLVYLGILLIFFNWVLFATSIFAALMFHLQIVNVEEDFLLEAFGEDYLDYKKKVNRYLGRKAKGKAKAIIISVICVILSVPLIILPATTVIVYESIFGERYETASWLEFSVEDYEGLQMERSDFQSEDVTLAGYKYSKPNQEIKGVVIIAHGLGGGGHNTYMPFIDYFTSNGYYVFAYDARGNDNSGGDSVGGLLKGYRKFILAYETQANPDFVGFNAVETLSKTNATVLLVYSDNDQMVRKSQYDTLCARLSDKANIKFRLEHNKGHNPNYTEDAVAYLGEYLAAKNKLTKKKKLVADEQKRAFLASFDWNRMTVQDESVWEAIFDCLDQ